MLSVFEGSSPPPKRLIAKLLRDPVKPVVKTIASMAAARLNVPPLVGKLAQAEPVRKLRRGQGVRKVLLVGEHQQDCIPQLVFAHHAAQLVAGFLDTGSVCRVNHHDKSLAVRAA